MAESYTVLARRYRSQSFDQLVGQEAIAQTLKNAIAAGRVAHAFLFTGTRGVGKTSSARILAKALNCPNAKNGEPCNTCETCKAIARGEDMDVIEIDGASNNGVDQVRELRQNAGIRPARSPYKIYIIDEVHMLSTGAFNALLKTLEEPPEHVKFIFATTDVHKVPATIISRVQRFDFKNIPTAKIAEHLKNVVKDEGIQADEDAIFRIARLGNGSMRDALSILDRVLSLGEKHITEKMLENLLGKPATAALAELVEALADGDAAAAIKRADALLKEGMGVEQVLGELVEFFRNLMLVATCGEKTELLDVPSESRPIFAKLAAKYDAPSLVHLIALCEQTLRSLKSSTMARPLFDALIVRLALSEQFSAIRDLLKSGGPDGDGGGPSHAAHGSHAPAPSLGQKKNDALTPPAPQAAPEAVSEEAPSAAPAAEPVAQAEPAAAPEATAPSADSAAESADGAAEEEGEESIYEIMKGHMARKVEEKNAAWAARQTGHENAAPSPPAGAGGGDDASMSFHAQMRAQLARQAAEQAARARPAPGRMGGRPGPQRPGAPGAAADQAPVAPVQTVSDYTDLPALWNATKLHLAANRAASVNTMLGDLARIEACDGTEATLAIPSHLRNYCGERVKARIEESIRAVSGRMIRLNVTTYEAAMPEGAGGGGGGPAAGPMAARVPPEVLEAVREAPIVKTLIERLGGDVSQVELLGEPEPEAPAE